MSRNSKELTSPLRYPGGKFRARKILNEYIPDNTKKILSPFFGGGSFELYLNNQGIEVVGYDNFWLLANFWKQLLTSSTTLAVEAHKHLGLVDKDLFKEFQQELKDYVPQPSSIGNAGNEQEFHDLAVKFFIVNRCSFSGATLSGGFSKSASETRFTQSIIDKLGSFKNPMLTINHGSFEDTLPEQSLCEDIDLLFLDPPYLLENHKNKLYGKNGDMHRGFNHELLRGEVEKTQKPFILTYNNCDEVKELWDGYKTYPAEWSYGMSKSKKSSELIITNIA